MTWTFQSEPKASHLRFEVFNCIDDIELTDWNKVVSNQNLFLSIPYLTSLEESLNSKISFKYIILYNEENEAVGVNYVQIISCTEVSASENTTIAKIGNHIKNKILGALDIKILVCGNIFSNGENGFYFIDKVDSSTIYDNLSNVLFKIRQSEDESSKPSMVLLKEFWPDTFEQSDILLEHDFREFMVDVNMVLDVHPSWNSTEDYLASMNTKFRTKAKSCFKKSKEIEIRSLDVSQIKENKSRIEELYLNVVHGAEFQFSKMSGDTFISFKKRLGDEFILNGYYLADKLVGFSTTFVNNDVLEAGYVGLDYEYNFKHAVYQKMLYNYVAQGIEHKSKEVRLGRTAEEIKSTLGALPVNMKLYARHRNSLSNRLIKPIIESITPSEFEVRKPFKSSFLEA